MIAKKKLEQKVEENNMVVVVVVVVVVAPNVSFLCLLEPFGTYNQDQDDQGSGFWPGVSDHSDGQQTSMKNCST